MKLRDKKEIHTKTVPELKKQLKDALALTVKKRLSLSLAALSNTSEIGSLRNEIAVIKTVLEQKRLTQTETKKDIDSKGGK
jgi:ribosomal protein L29